jgi:cobalamin-dependent methionine synthase I
MAVTLGPGPDLLIRRAGIEKVSRAVILQAAAAAMTETWCDQVNERIRLEAERNGLYTRPRYSPGYGDLPLTMQTDISRILNMPKEIGVSLTDSLLMTPSKSVTALIGVSQIAGDCRRSGCAECSASSTCIYRAEA